MNARTPPGPGVDAAGQAISDPTKNVDQLVAASDKRQDDLRTMEATSLRRELRAEAAALRREAELRAGYEEKLRTAESDRLDAIRSVDVAAVRQAAEDTRTQAAVLAAQLTATADASRAQTAAVAQATATALGAALDPIVKDIGELRRSQYELAGQRAQVSETREVRGESRLNLGAVLGVVSVLLVLFFGIAGLAVTLILRATAR